MAPDKEMARTAQNMHRSIAREWGPDVVGPSMTQPLSAPLLPFCSVRRWHTCLDILRSGAGEFRDHQLCRKRFQCGASLPVPACRGWMIEKYDTSAV
eukprot:5071430-Pleurochrysis_carterae.AAC.1